MNVYEQAFDRWYNDVGRRLQTDKRALKVAWDDALTYDHVNGPSATLAGIVRYYLENAHTSDAHFDDLAETLNDWDRETK
jgi:hypothetical protein